MPCIKNCRCVLCKELKHIETCNNQSDITDKNFILMSPRSSRISDDFERTRSLHAKLISEINSKCIDIQKEFVDKCEGDRRANKAGDLLKCSSDNLHKSVVYISGSIRSNKINKRQDGQEHASEVFENIDESTFLTYFDENDNLNERNVINVVFKNSFENANQIIKDVTCANQFCDVFFSDDDDFPLGMEADFLNR